jgi:glucose-6-phosphate isomerase
MPSLTALPAWKKLSAHYKKVSKLHLRDLFAKDPTRFEKFSLQVGDILLDYSKNRITEETFNLLIELAKQTKVKANIEKMFRGEKINFTENRPALHIALRNRANRPNEEQKEKDTKGINKKKKKYEKHLNTRRRNS